jgi:hypothetical protein
MRLKCWCYVCTLYAIDHSSWHCISHQCTLIDRQAPACSHPIVGSEPSWLSTCIYVYKYNQRHIKGRVTGMLAYISLCYICTYNIEGRALGIGRTGGLLWISNVATTHMCNTTLTTCTIGTRGLMNGSIPYGPQLADQLSSNYYHHYHYQVARHPKPPRLAFWRRKLGQT